MKIVSAIIVSALIAAGCASSGQQRMDENAVVHHVTEAERAATQSKDPIAADSAVLYVNGLGCPLCATNVDTQLLRVRGVRSATVDLGAGTVTLGLSGSPRPSPAALRTAVEDAGFTLMKIETH